MPCSVTAQSTLNVPVKSVVFRNVIFPLPALAYCKLSCLPCAFRFRMILPVDALPRRICGARGRPLAKEAFGNDFSEAARQAGIQKSAHGVRKIAATIAAENGATEKELDALFGWVDGGRTSGIYARDANRAKLAAQAGHKLDETGTSMPAPTVTVRTKAENQPVISILFSGNGGGRR